MAKQDATGNAGAGACAGEITLRWDIELRGCNVFRAKIVRESATHRVVRIEATVKTGHLPGGRNRVECISEVAHEFSRHTPTDRDGPALIRAGSGDGSVWQLQPWRAWSEKYNIATGTSFLLIQCPAEWPRP